MMRLEDFAGEYFVSLSADDPYRRLIDARFAEAGVARTLRMETHSAAAVCAMVQQGLGVAIVNPVTALATAVPPAPKPCAMAWLRWRWPTTTGCWYTTPPAAACRQKRWPG